MHIIQHGSAYVATTKRITCDNCACVFDITKKDLRVNPHYVPKRTTVVAPGQRTVNAINCPECNSYICVDWENSIIYQETSWK